MQGNKILVNLISWISVLIFPFGCKKSLKDDLVNKINKECGNHPDSNCKIAFDDVTKFKWDRMYFLPNWTTSDSITRLIGFNYVGDDVPDQYCRMLFTIGSKVIYEEDFESLDYYKSTVDFDEMTNSVFKMKPYYLPASKATFSVKADKIENSCNDCYSYSLRPACKSK